MATHGKWLHHAVPLQTFADHLNILSTGAGHSAGLAWKPQQAPASNQVKLSQELSTAADIWYENAGVCACGGFLK